jgi:hypothetical protein
LRDRVSGSGRGVKYRRTEVRESGDGFALNGGPIHHEDLEAREDHEAFRGKLPT